MLTVLRRVKTSDLRSELNLQFSVKHYLFTVYQLGTAKFWSFIVRKQNIYIFVWYHFL